MGETELRWQLRQLPREIDSTRDLWPGIAGQIQHRPLAARRSWLNGWAIAASLILAFGLFWHQQADQPSSPDEMTARIVQHEAAAMTSEYQVALDQFEQAPMPAPFAPGLRSLDTSAAQIRSALAADPDSVALLQQLRKTYSRRLALTQRALTS